MSDREDPSLLAAGHALGSLTPKERAEYEAYLAESDEARREATGFDVAAKAIDVDVADVAPPAVLKARLMAQIAATPQLTGPEAAPALPRATPEPHEPPAPSQVGPAEQRAQARWFSRPSLILAAAVAAAVLLVGGGAIGLAIGTGSSVEQQQATTLAQISAAPDAQRSSHKVAGGGDATLIWSEQLGKSAVVLDGLKPPPAGKTYQLWYISGKTATSAGLLSADSDASTWQVLDGRLRGGEVVGMTVEPDGGSKAPTTKPILTIQS